MKFSFPNEERQQRNVDLEPGQVVFVAGANGTGKSALMHKLFVANRAIAKRITAHRQTWLANNSVNMTPANKAQTEGTVAREDSNPHARWLDQHGQVRSNITIYDLIESGNVRARAIEAAADSGDIDKVQELAEEPSSLALLNGVLEAAGLSIVISILEGQHLFASKNGSALYSVAELSDGERNALLIGARILTAKPETLLVIDEPERHLHESIVSPLLLALFEARRDCSFVVSTHDLSLPADCPQSRTLLLRSCVWEGTNVVGWETDLLEEGAAPDEDIKRAILGARRKILFVEGNLGSLDRRVYEILYPELSVVPLGSCAEVCRAVAGVRSSTELHWLEACGLVDRDDRTEEEIKKLAERSIFAVAGYSVESLYYCSEVRDKVALRARKLSEEIANPSRATQAILHEVATHKERLCANLIVRRARATILSDLPTRESLRADPVHTVSFDATQLIAEETAWCDKRLEANDADALLDRYPLRETGALAGVARALGFENRHKYESAVRQLLKEDEQARTSMREKLRAVTSAVADVPSLTGASVA